MKKFFYKYEWYYWSDNKYVIKIYFIINFIKQMYNMIRSTNCHRAAYGLFI